ncbi:DUF4422 domain-containing protein [Lacticaseibacillus thailandensis]|uniref:Capsular biosynthesis protein n=1 Tax=Lacticaseibacillus thailandensis DSM 22698 = JCM 13996 TaxID=1423810 RepID=A0A0R2CH34_9LACO|nr:DUF4422 domain-containing protein [Lacticaseibacillus thailandensis]KRM87801.1 capsular biosynthesis protein [Lacticaseibacillus thailandensis DSM 22698 = JCM 13996]
MDSLFIGVAAHKQYQMPSDSVYHPIQVGALDKPTLSGYQRDDDGDNISALNPNFSELTATYWLWKNCAADYKGLVHYRRYFTINKPLNPFSVGKFSQVMTAQQWHQLLAKYPVVLPTKRHYYVETLYSHYQHSHDIEPLDVTRGIIQRNLPDYLTSFDKVMQRKSAHMFNMFVMRTDYFDAYSTWLFGILFDLRNHIDIAQYSVQEARVFGYISELLLDVWLDVQQPLFTEVPVMFMENQHWAKKIWYFGMRKLLGGSKKDAHIE